MLAGVQPMIARDVAGRVMSVFREFVAPALPAPDPVSRAMPASRALAPARHARMPPSGSFSAPPSAAPGSVSFAASGSAHMPPSGSTPGSASESTLPGSMASGSGSAFGAPGPSIPYSPAPGMTAFRHTAGGSDSSASGAMPASAPPTSTSFQSQSQSQSRCSMGPASNDSSSSLVPAPLSVVPSSTAMSVMPASADTVMSEAPGLASSAPAGPGCGMLASDIDASGSMFGPGFDAMAGPMLASGSAFMPFMSTSDSIISAAIESSSPAPPADSRPGSALSPALHASVSLSNANANANAMPAFNLLGPGLDLMGDPLAYMSTHLDDPSLSGAGGEEVDVDFDMHELLNEFLDPADGEEHGN